MTDKQPEALRLADLLDYAVGIEGYVRDEAAAELRRLHQSEREGWRYVGELEQERKRLSEVNAELLEALKRLSLYVAYNGDDWVQREANAALAKATGENNG